MEKSKPFTEFRVVKRHFDQLPYYIIMEIWYDEKGKIEGWIEDPHPFGESIRELKADYEKFKKAFSKDILEYDKFSASTRVKSKFSNC